MLCSRRCLGDLGLCVLLLLVSNIQGRPATAEQGGREASGPPPYLNATSANGTTDSSTTANATTAESPAPDPSASPAVGKGASACPAALLPYLKQQQQPAHNSANTTQDVNGSAVGTNDTSNNATQQHGSRKKEEKAQEQQQQPNQGQKQQLVPAWPPPALKQGLTCTMEVSHLAVALPGTADVCSVFRITNNLLSALYSWQLVWDPSAAGGLLAVGADGAVVITSSDPDEQSVRVINTAQSPEIAPQGGTVDFVVQMGLPAELGNSNSGSSSNSSSSSGRRTRVSPGVASVYLNGLQCTRLPLLPADANSSAGDSPDCTATRWPVTADARFEALGGALNSSSSSNSSDSNSSNGNSALAAALSWLSCSAQYCCGLQVVPTDSGDQGKGGAVPGVAAFDGPDGADNSSEANATMSAPVGAGDSSGAASPDITASEKMSNLIPPPADVPAPADASSGINTRSSNISSSVLLGVVIGIIGAFVLAAVALLMVRHRRQKRRKQQLLQLFKAQGDEPMPHLATAALVRAASSASSESSGSQNTQAGGAGSVQAGSSLASSNSLDGQHLPPAMRGAHWKARQSASPYHTAPAPYLGPAAAAATAAGIREGLPPTGGVWRAGSWQGPDRPASHLPLPGRPLLRSASSPQQALQDQRQQERASQPQSPHKSTTAASAPAPCKPASPAPTGPALTLDSHRRTGVLRMGSADAASLVTSAAAALAPTSRLASSSGAAGSTDLLSRGVSGVSVISSQSSSSMLPDGKAAAQTMQAGQGTLYEPSTGGSTWGSLRRFFSSSSRPPKSSMVSPGSSLSTLGMSSNTAAQGHSNASTAVTVSSQFPGGKQPQDQSLQHQKRQSPLQAQMQLAPYYSSSTRSRNQHLQLIQETAPLAAPAVAADQLARPNIGQHQQHDLKWLAAGVPLAVSGSGASSGSGGGMLLSTVSRRISPILSVVEDGSSATSNDSLAGPAAWHLADRHLLMEDTPGWLNIDFAREVRLERKLGEGGFGQVFRARWHDEVIAAKLVPFMSLVAHTQLSVSLLGAELSGHGTSTGAGAAGSSSMSPRPSGSTAADAMGVGMQFSAASLRAIKMEIKVLSQLSHDNIVAFKGACLAPAHICILEELAEGGSLYARLYSRSSRRITAAPPAAAVEAGTDTAAPAGIRRRRKAAAAGSSSCSRAHVLPPPLGMEELLRIAIDVATAMQYLHNMQPQVVHRDLKPQNVLLDLQGRAKVCDFGISKMKDASLAASSTRLQAGTPAYMAPEQFEGHSATDKVDVFAFGVLLHECCEQRQPWRDMSPMQIIYAVGVQKERLKCPASCPDGLWRLIEACWQQQPEARPSFTDILAALEQLQQQLADGAQAEQQQQT